MEYSVGSQLEVKMPTGGYAVVEVKRIPGDDRHADFIGKGVYSDIEVSMTDKSIKRVIGKGIN